MIEKNVICVLILLVGIYVFIRPADVAEKIRKFYSQYPIVRYAGSKQLTSRTVFVRLLGLVVIFFAIFSIFAI